MNTEGQEQNDKKIELMEWLWLVEDPAWTLPIWISRQDTVISMRLAVPMLRVQKNALYRRLRAYGAFTNDGGFYIEAAQLDKIGYLVDPPVNPETLVQWRYVERERKGTVNPMNKDEFFLSMARSGWVKSAESARVLWTMMCRHALHWLTTTKEPVDMGFCTLRAVPLRPNWMSVIIQNVIKQYRNSKERGAVSPAVAFHQSGTSMLHRLIEDDRLLFMDKRNRLMLWSLHVRHRTAWWQRIDEIEKAQLRRFRGRYWNRARALLQDYGTILAKSFHSFCREITHPYPKLYGGPGSRDAAIDQGRGDPPVKSPLAGSRYAQVDVRAWKFDKGARPCVEGQDEGVPEMRHFRPTEKELWQSWADDEGTNHGRFDEAGVLVLDALESTASTG